MVSTYHIKSLCGEGITHFVLLGINVVHIIDHSTFEIMSFAPDARHHYSRLFLELSDGYGISSTGFDLTQSATRNGKEHPV